MATFTAVTKTKAARLIAAVGEALPDNTIATGPVSDVRFIFSITIDADCVIPVGGGKPDRKISAGVMQLNCFTSYKKHIAESYHDIGDYRPTPATVDPKAPHAVQLLQNRNTITSLTIAEFVDAFDEYGEHLKSRMVGKDVVSFNPSALGVFDTSKGIAFMNNNDSFGKPFHCFPTTPAAATPVSRDITGRELMDLVELMKFRYYNGIIEGSKGNVAQAWAASVKKMRDQYHNEPWFQALVSLADRQEIDTILAGIKGRIDALKAAEGALKRGGNANPDAWAGGKKY